MGRISAAIHGTYTLKSVKTFRGMDGIGLNAVLCRDGKAVCEVIDEGSGGETYFRWHDQMHGESKEREAFLAFIEAEREKIPADKQDEFGMKAREVYGAETWVNRVVDDLENAKRMRRLCKTSTCYQAGPQIGGDEFYKVKGVGPAIRAAIERRHAGQKVVFLNDQFEVKR